MQKVRQELDRVRQRLDDLRRDVLGRDEIDVVTTTVLQAQHDVRDPLGVEFLAVSLLRDVPVLTEHTAQITKPEKDCA